MSKKKKGEGGGGQEKDGGGNGGPFEPPVLRKLSYLSMLSTLAEWVRTSSVSRKLSDVAQGRILSKLSLLIGRRDGLVFGFPWKFLIHALARLELFLFGQ